MVEYSYFREKSVYYWVTSPILFVSWQKETGGTSSVGYESPSYQKKDHDMNNVAEFIEVRQRIEFLAKEITVLIERKGIPQSKTKLDEASELLVKLTSMADNDVQHIAVGRLTRLLATLTKTITAQTPKKRVAKSAAKA
jgi:hypothetical protein